MKIKLYWPNCNLSFKGISFDSNDAFFLECSLDEAKEQLFKRLTDEQINQCHRDYEPILNEEHLVFGNESNKICFLITKDQKTLLPQPWYYPYAGQWNAYSPFVEIKEIEIKRIEHLTDIVVDLDLG